MKTFATFAVLAALTLWLAVCKPPAQTTTTAPRPAEAPVAAKPPGPGKGGPAERIRQEIAGVINLPADSVFENIEVIKDRTAGELLTIMEHWSQALGVRCSHCHVPGEWASEVKAEKQVARQMVRLVAHTNADLAKLTGLEKARPSVNCTSCHRGALKPARQRPEDAAPDALAADRTQKANLVRQAIRGLEKTAVDSVFRNLRMLKGFPAETLPAIMERWSEALGVSCGHCHVPGDWAADGKREKTLARQMITLTEQVNTQVRQISGLKSDKPGISCYSCHRGELKPALRLVGK